MEKLEGIVLKKGDKVTFFDGSVVYSNEKCSPNKYFFDNEIIKIERPVKYETIYEAPKQILDKEEKAYLENFLRPFKSNIIYIEKYISLSKNYYIKIYFNDFDNIQLPDFKKDTMYKGMELNKEYTLDELGLFKESK